MVPFSAKRREEGEESEGLRRRGIKRLKEKERHRESKTKTDKRQIKGNLNSLMSH